jgi:hypothetical protein
MVPTATTMIASPLESVLASLSVLKRLTLPSNNSNVVGLLAGVLAAIAPLEVVEVGGGTLTMTHRSLRHSAPNAAPGASGDVALLAASAVHV